MKLVMTIADCTAFEAAVKFFSAKGLSAFYSETVDVREQTLTFDVYDQDDADSNEEGITDEWLEYCHENGIDDDFSYSSAR
jgi:HKD family nuclease